LSATTSNTNEGGLGFIHDNLFFGPGNAGGSQGPCIYSEVGYGHVHDNVFTGGAGAVNFSAANFPAGGMKIHHNTIEDGRLYGVSVSSVANTAIAMVQIDCNEFSGASVSGGMIAPIVINDNATSSYISDLQITNNVMRMVMSGTSGYINVSTGTNVQITGNQLENIGPTVNTAIRCNGSFLLAQARVAENQLVANPNGYTNLYDCKNLVVVRDLTTGVPFVALGGWNNGSEVYVSDGRTTTALSNLTVRAGGTGCVAWRMSGAWYCLQQ
jgi:hypothetical protein